MSAKGMSSSEILDEIKRLTEKKEERVKKLDEITKAMDEVTEAWSGVGDTGYKNSFNYIKNNSNNYWNVVDKSGSPCGDVVSFCDSLDTISDEISNGDVSVAMNEVMEAATEKVAELKAEIESIDAEI